MDVVTRSGQIDFVSSAALPDLLAGRADPRFPEERLHVLAAVADYLNRFLGRSNPMLGRSGMVCPFIRAASQRGMVMIGISDAVDGEEERLDADVRAAEAMFDRVADSVDTPDQRIFAATVLALPGLATRRGVDLINAVQREAKLRFVERGRMIGQFYPGCPEPGLHSSTFRPLDAPVPFLAIRHMTISDAPFMLGDERHRQSYLANFGEEGAQMIARAATRAPSPAAGSAAQPA